MVWNDHVQDTDVLAARLKEAEVLVLIREPLPERLDALRLKVLNVLRDPGTP